MLRAVVTADLNRDSATTASLDESIRALRDAPRLGNREADLYRTHVLVKAVLERGDPQRALDLLPSLETSPDEEERVYAAWLRVWFDLEGEVLRTEGEETAVEAPLTVGELRLATLLARAHGAEKLVDKARRASGSHCAAPAGREQCGGLPMLPAVERDDETIVPPAPDPGAPTYKRASSSS